MRIMGSGRRGGDCALVDRAYAHYGSRVLLDAEDTGTARRSACALSSKRAPQHHVADLHVWRVGIDAYACIVTVVTHRCLGRAS